MSNAVIDFIPKDWSTSQCNYEEPLVISRLHRVPDASLWRLWVLGVIFGIAFFIYVGCFILFLVRIRHHPLKQRSPSLLLISALGGTFALGYMYSRQFFDLVLVCPITYYVVEISMMVFLLPYILRCFRTICLWNVNIAKAKMLQKNDEATEKKGKGMTAGRTNFLVKYRVLYSEKFLFFAMIIFCFLWLVVGIIVQISAEFSPSQIWNPKCQKKCQMEEGVALKVFVCIMAAMLVPYAILVIAMRNMNDDFSIRNELLALCGLSILLVIPMVVLVFIPGQFWPDSPVIGYLLGAEMLLSFVISVVAPLVQTFTRGVDIFACFKKQSSETQALTDTSSVMSPTKSESTTSPAVEEEHNKIEASVKVDETGTVVKAAAIGIEQNTSTPTNTSEFDFFLTNKEAKECFKQFLVREFSVENLMFYTEVQYFKKLSADDEELPDTAKTIYETYVQVGAPFEINISVDLRNAVEKALAEKPLTNNVFTTAEGAVYRAMLKESFPRFAKGKMYQNFKAKMSAKKGGK